jgi:RNA 3'-terminal phosphate cyclase (ATP)
MPSKPSLITLDGSHGEGGGALLRAALCASALTEQGVTIYNIRGGMRHPGLDAEDLTLIEALKECTAAEAFGVGLKSERFTFIPSRKPTGINGRLSTFRNESNRGPNVPIVLNCLLPVLARSGVYSSLSLEGETYGANSLGFDAFQNLSVEAQKVLGLYCFPTQIAAGFGRESRGEIQIDVEPSHLEGADWTDRGQLVEIGAVVATANLPANVGDRGVAHLRSLSKQAGIQLEAEHRELESASPGCHVTVWARYERGFGGASAIGTRGVRVETLCQTTFSATLGWMQSNACFDAYVAEQVLPTAVFAESPTTMTVSELTGRLLTSVWVMKQFLPIHLTVKGNEGEPGVISVRR